MVQWVIARRKKITGFGPDVLLLASESGASWYSEGSKNPQVRFTNVWNELIRRVRKEKEHEGFRRLPLGTLRDTLPDIIRHRYGDERDGVTPFNLLPIPSGPQLGGREKHPAATPYDAASRWCRYILPEKGVLLDPMCGYDALGGLGSWSGAGHWDRQGEEVLISGPAASPGVRHGELIAATLLVSPVSSQSARA